MLNLSDLTGYFIEYHFTDAQKLLLLNGFTVLETFAFDGGYYEDKYVNLIANENITNDTKQLNFLVEMQSDILSVIKQHGIVINRLVTPDLSTLLEIAHGLILLANLEDYTDVAYRVHGTGTNRKILIDLLERYTMLSEVKLMESIESVEDTLIESLRELSVDALHEEAIIKDTKHQLYITRFFEFIDGHPCLGKTLYEKGYKSNLTLEELLNLLPYSVTSYIEKEETTNLPQVALDVLSLLIITRDDYDLPLFKIKKLGYLFTGDIQLLNRISNVILKIMNDFGVQLEAYKQGDKLNDN